MMAVAGTVPTRAELWRRGYFAILAVPSDGMPGHGREVDYWIDQGAQPSWILGWIAIPKWIFMFVQATEAVLSEASVRRFVEHVRSHHADAAFAWSVGRARSSIVDDEYRKVARFVIETCKADGIS